MLGLHSFILKDRITLDAFGALALKNKPETLPNSLVRQFLLLQVLFLKLDCQICLRRQEIQSEEPWEVAFFFFS